MPCQAGQSQNKHRQTFWLIMPRAITAALLTLVLLLAAPARVLAEAGAEVVLDGIRALDADESQNRPTLVPEPADP